MLRQPSALAGSLVALLVVAVVGCSKNDPPTKAATPAPEKDKSEVKMDAVAWHAEFKKDARAAEAKYKGRPIELSGTVTEIATHVKESYAYVNLKTDDGINTVICALRNKKPWSKISPGSNVKIRGTAKGESIYDADIVDAGPNPGIVISGPDLAKECIENFAEAKKKYNEKWAYVTGEVVECQRQPPADGGADLLIKGQEGFVLTFRFHKSDDLQPLDKAKPGSKVKLYGKLLVLKKEVIAHGCDVMEVQ